MATLRQFRTFHAAFDKGQVNMQEFDRYSARAVTAQLAALIDSGIGETNAYNK
jgi:hypothetical protein